MAFTAKILSWRLRHLNIVGCLLKRRPTKGWSRAPQDLPLATPLLSPDIHIQPLGTDLHTFPWKTCRGILFKDQSIFHWGDHFINFYYFLSLLCTDIGWRNLMLITHGTTADVTVPCTSIMMFGVNFIYSFFWTEYCQSIICYYSSWDNFNFFCNMFRWTGILKRDASEPLHRSAADFMHLNQILSNVMGTPPKMLTQRIPMLENLCLSTNHGNGP